VLCLARKRRNTDFLIAHEDVNDRTFTDVGVSNRAHVQSFVCIIVLLHRARRSFKPSEKLGSRENLSRAELQVFLESLIKLTLALLGFLLLACLALQLVLEASVGLLDLLHLLSVEHDSLAPSTFTSSVSLIVFI